MMGPNDSTQPNDTEGSDAKQYHSLTCLTCARLHINNGIGFQ